MLKVDNQISEKSLRPSSILMLAVWFAVVTGLGEVLGLIIARYLLQQYRYYFGLHSVWMIPLGDVIIFAIPSLLLVSMARLRPSMATRRLVIFVFTVLALTNWLFLVDSLDRRAGLVLAVGLAAQLSKWACNLADRATRLTQSASGWLGHLWILWASHNTKTGRDTFSPGHRPISRRQFLLGAAGTLVTLRGGVHVLETVGENLARARIPIPVRMSPNVLLIVLDTVRAMNTSLYGYARDTTPNLRRLAQRGGLFERAYSTAPWTLPSHASMFTGRFPHDLSVGYQTRLDEHYPTLAEVLGAQGYLCAGFAANTLYCSAASGLNRGFLHYEDFSQSLEQVVGSPSLARAAADSESIRQSIGYYQEVARISAADINDSFLNWLARRDQRRPFFAFLNYFDAHAPYLPPSPFSNRFGSDLIRKHPRFGPFTEWSPDQVQAELNSYDASIAFIDYHLGILFEELERRGESDNTIAIIVADHGEEFLEHGLMEHGYSLYQTALHVPLLILFPQSVPQAVTVRQLVSLRDLPATILDLLNFHDVHALGGTSLASCWDNSRKCEPDSTISELAAEHTGLPEWYPVMCGDLTSLLADQYHYIKCRNGDEELYDVMVDALEHQNLVQTPSGQSVLGSMRARLKVGIGHE